MFITLEGIEGSGKGTVLARLVELLRARGEDPVVTREPGGSRLGKDIRAMLLDTRNSDLVPEAELFLYLADRAQHVCTVILPALEAGKTVISDRYADSTIVYQGYARGLGPEKMFRLNDLAVRSTWPDLTVVLDLPARVGLERARKRNLEQGLADKEGRFEAESLNFHEAVRQGYLDWAGAHPGRIRVVDATGSPEEVFARVEALLARSAGEIKSPL